MSGYRVGFDIHPLVDQADGKDWMLVLNGWSVWRLTDAEARDLSAELLLKLARGNDSQPIDAGHPDLWSLSAPEPY